RSVPPLSLYETLPSTNETASQPRKSLSDQLRAKNPRSSLKRSGSTTKAPVSFVSVIISSLRPSSLRRRASQRRLDEFAHLPLVQERRAERAQEPLHAPLRARAQEARAEELPRGAHATPRRHVVEADRAFELRLHLAVEREDFRVVRHRVNLRAQSAPSGEHRRVLSARARRVRAHERQRPVEVAELETLPRERAANPVVPVLDRRQNRVERPDLFDDRA